MKLSAQEFQSLQEYRDKVNDLFQQIDLAGEGFRQFFEWAIEKGDIEILEEIASVLPPCYWRFEIFRAMRRKEEEWKLGDPLTPGHQGYSKEDFEEDE
jgi:hypothetical protein